MAENGNLVLTSSSMTVESTATLEVAGDLTLDASHLEILRGGIFSVGGSITLSNSSTITNLAETAIEDASYTVDSTSAVLNLGAFIETSETGVMTVKAETSVTADPYIKSANGKITKTPDTHGFYRLFENGDMFVNVEVDNLNISQSLTDFLIGKGYSLEQLNGQRPITDGYWNKAVYIESEGNKFAYDLFNLKTLLSKDRDSYFAVKTNKHKRSRQMSGVPVHDTIAQTITVEWNHSVYGKQSVTLDLYENPQIQNGIRVNSKLVRWDDSIGLLVRNYKAKYMALNSLTEGKNRKLRKTLVKDEVLGKTLFHETPIKGPGEKWYTVKDKKTTLMK